MTLALSAFWIMAGDVPFWALLCRLNPHPEASGPSSRKMGERSFSSGQWFFTWGEWQILNILNNKISAPPNVCVYFYVCMYICMYVYIYVCTHI